MGLKIWRRFLLLIHVLCCGNVWAEEPCLALKELINATGRPDYSNSTLYNSLDSAVTPECRVLVKEHKVPEIEGFIVDEVAKRLAGADTERNRFAMDALCHLHPTWAVDKIAAGISGSRSRPNCLRGLSAIGTPEASTLLRKFIAEEGIERDDINARLLMTLEDTRYFHELRLLRKLAASLLPTTTAKNIWRHNVLHELVCLPEERASDPSLEMLCSQNSPLVREIKKESNFEEGFRFVALHLFICFAYVFIVFRARNQELVYFLLVPGGIIGGSALLAGTALIMSGMMEEAAGPLGGLSVIPAVFGSGILGGILGAKGATSLSKDAPDSRVIVATISAGAYLMGLLLFLART